MNFKRGKRILAVVLAGTLLGTQIPGMTVAEGAAGYTGGICEHHPEHTEECGYQEAVPEQPCRHEHTKECYEYVTSCVHVHTEECYPLIAVSAGDQAAEGTAEESGTAEGARTAAEPQTELVRGSEPTACTHVCSEESGCVTKTLNCIHEDTINADGSITYAVHDESCGYAPAVEGKECTFVCEICSAPEETDSESETSTEKNTEAGTEGTDEDETDSETETSTEETPDSDAETETDEAAPDEAVTKVQAQIDALPSVSEVEQMTKDEQKEVYDKAQDAADAYFDLSEEQQKQVDTARLEELLNFFNGQVSTMAEVVNSGTGWTLDDAGVLTITSNSGITDWKHQEVSENEITKVFISDNVTGAINESLFMGSNNLTEVTIGNGVTSIGSSAFDYCTSLSEVTIGNGVTSIGNGAFNYCPSLSKVTIGNSVTSIGNDAFEYCRSLSEVRIPDSVTSIGNNAFKYCNSLSEVTIGNSVTSIGDEAFYYCFRLSKVTIPDSVTSIGNNAFGGCLSLSEVTIGNRVTSIGNQAFDCCDISEVKIPDSVTSIGSRAFFRCNDLTKVALPKTAPASASTDSFDGLWNQINFIIPETSIGTGDGQYDLSEEPWSNIEKLNGKTFDGEKYVIDSVTVELDEPQAEQPLSGTVTCNTDGVSQVSIKWTTGDEEVTAGENAEFGTTYTAEVTLSADTEATPIGYKFTGQTTVTLNGESVTGTAGDDGSTLTFTKEYTTEELVVATVTFDNGTSQNYASLDEAFAAAADKTATIELKKDATLSSTVTITGNVIFKGGNFKATQLGANINVSGTLNMESGAIDYETSSCVDCKSGGKVNVQDGNIKQLLLSGGTANISGGTIGVLTHQRGTANISGGTIENLDLQRGTANISGGTISELSLRKGTANISGGTIDSLKDRNQGGKVIYNATDITLDKTALSLAPDDTEELTATVEQNSIKVNGENISVPVTWESSAPNVATVEFSGDGGNATVTAVGPGEATITAIVRTIAEMSTATCTVTVEKNTTTITNKDEDGYQTSFIHGDTIPEPTESSFTIDGSNNDFSWKWYGGDHTAGELPSENIVSKPDAAGTYTLVVATAETDTYTAGELRLLVTIAGAEYHITIPSSAEAGGEEVSVSITENSTFKIGSNGKVRVAVSDGAQDGTVTLTRQNDGGDPATITSELLNGKGGSALKNGDTVALYDVSGKLAGDTTGKLYCAAPAATAGTVIPAGNYSGMITFQISYEIGGQTE